MTQTLRMPLEAKSSRISFHEDAERDEDNIVCRYRDEWAIESSWDTEAVVTKPRKTHHFQVYTSGWTCSLPIKSINVGSAWDEIDWTKISAALHSKALLLGDAIETVSLENQFNELATRWYRETGMLSLLHKKVMHPAYQRIIGMGKDALPFIFRELNTRGGHWLWALCAITGEDAAKPEQNLKQAVKAWLDWGKEHGYL
jgi:hypothetical protein